MDVETTGAEPYIGSGLLGIGLGAMGETEEYFYAPVEGVPPKAFGPVIEVLERLPLLGHNIKFDLHMLAQGLGWAGGQERFFDLIVLARLLAPSEHPDLRLEALVQQYLGYGYDSAAVKAVVAGREVSVEDLALKNVHDLRATKHLYYHLKAQAPPHLLRLFAEECRITRDLYDIERRGELIDQDYLARLLPLLDGKIGDARVALRELTADEKFNPSSAPQVQALMEGLGVKPVKWSAKSGKPSWDKEAMLAVRGQNPVCMGIARYRSLVHLQANIPARCAATVAAGEDALHGTLKNWGTATGRLASSDPNRQNDPHGWLQGEADPAGEDVLKWAAGPEQELSVERLFIARPGHVLVRADYRQIEMVILGAYMNDPTFDRWLASGNVHAAVAEELYGDAVKFYARGKTRNFALVYGQGVAAEAKADGVSEEEVRRRRQEYFARMPGYPRLLNKLRRMLANDHKVRNFFGREYHLPDDLAYVAVNYLVQGSAGDFVKQRLPATRELRRELGIHVLKTTHDDFTFEVPRASLHEMPRLLAALVVNPFGREFGLDVEWSEYSMAHMRPVEEDTWHAPQGAALAV